MSDVVGGAAYGRADAEADTLRELGEHRAHFEWASGLTAADMDGISAENLASRAVTACSLAEDALLTAARRDDWLRTQLDGCIEYAEYHAEVSGLAEARALVGDLKDARAALAGSAPLAALPCPVRGVGEGTG